MLKDEPLASSQKKNRCCLTLSAAPIFAPMFLSCFTKQSTGEMDAIPHQLAFLYKDRWTGQLTPIADFLLCSNLFKGCVCGGIIFLFLHSSGKKHDQWTSTAVSVEVGLHAPDLEHVNVPGLGKCNFCQGQKRVSSHATHSKISIFPAIPTPNCSFKIVQDYTLNYKTESFWAKTCSRLKCQPPRVFLSMCIQACNQPEIQAASPLVLVSSSMLATNPAQFT